MIGIDMSATGSKFLSDKRKRKKLTALHPSYPTLVDKRRNIAARYFDGCGHGGSSLDYLWNGATGSDIGQECMNAYEFLIQDWDSHECKIWLFGHSRGAFTVRSVAAMINNCGTNKTGDAPERTRGMCEQVYHIYRSPWADDAPQEPRMRRL
jgi:uncharacterized protein (DUF2235 family)